MLALLMAAMMSLPLYPLNPVEEDTLASVNAHISLGFRAPSDVVSAGPELSAKYELLIMHPVVVRTSVDYKYGELSARQYPRGPMHAVSFALESFYYRGTDKLTGYIGAGALFTVHSFKPHAWIADSLRSQFAIREVRIDAAPGFRIALGLRYRSVYALELTITEMRSNLNYIRDTGIGMVAERKEEIRLSDIRVTFGYLFTLRDW
jgi:hypothetical protein